MLPRFSTCTDTSATDVSGTDTEKEGKGSKSKESWEIKQKKKRIKRKTREGQTPPGDKQKDKKSKSHLEVPRIDRLVFIKGKHGSFAKAAISKPIETKKEIVSTYGGVETIKIQGDYVLVTCTTLQQKGKLMLATEIIGQMVEVTEAWKGNKTTEQKDGEDITDKVENEEQVKNLQKGIIFGVALELSEEDIKYDTGAYAVRRMTKYVEGNKEITPNVILSYRDLLPERTQIGFDNFRIRKYIPLPFRCTNCQRFGHGHKTCWRPKCCVRCSGNHEFADCTVEIKSEKVKCLNCNGNHSAAWSQCPKYQEVRDTLKISVQKNLTYAEALQTVKVTQKDEETSSQESESDTQTETESSSESEGETKTECKHKKSSKLNKKKKKKREEKSSRKNEEKETENHSKTKQSKSKKKNKSETETEEHTHATEEKTKMEKLYMSTKCITEMLRFCIVGILLSLQNSKTPIPEEVIQNCTTNMLQFSEICGLEIRELLPPQ